MLPAAAFGLTGYDVAKAVDSRKEPKDMKATLTMVLTNKRGKTRTSTIRSVSKDGTEKQIVWFLSPPDDKGVAFLKIEHDDKEDEMRLWLPAFKKIRRITAKKKADSFMGSDISYEDMTTRDLDDYSYELSGEETVEGKTFHVLVSTPNIRSAYGRIVSWVSMDDYTVLKEEFYDRSGSLYKKRSVKYQSIKGYDVPEEMFMEDLQKRHTTRLTFDNIDVDTGVKDGLFQEKNLKRLPR
jgi:outer membrane lipoprotein-sorting protein